MRHWLLTETPATQANSVLATDASPGMLAFSRESLRDANIEFQLADCQQTSLATRAFDTAFLGLVLQFVDHSRTIAEMHRMLRPGGMLIIANLNVLALTVRRGCAA